MSKKIETIVDDIYDVLDDDGRIATKDNLDYLGKAVMDAVAQSMAQKSDTTGKARIRASGIGKACNRQQWYGFQEFETIPLQSNTKLMFLYGHVIEALLLFLAKEAGHAVSCEQEEVTVAGIKGHIDAEIDGVTVDAKSTSPRSFDKFKYATLEKDDPFGYMDQINFYKEGRNTRGGFLAMDKQFGHLAWMEVKGKKSVVPRIEELKELAKEETPEPARVSKYNPVEDGKSGNLTLCTECKYCNHKFNCWADANGGKGLRVFLYSNGPKYLTNVAKLPKVPEVGA